MKEQDNFEAIRANINRIVTDVKDFKEMFNKIFSEINAFASRTFKIYWNYSEKNCDSYKLEDAIKWVKENLPEDGEGYNACLFKDMEPIDDIIIIHHFYLLNNKPCLDGTRPYFVVYTKELSDSLTNQFGEKSLIIFK